MITNEGFAKIISPIFILPRNMDIVSKIFIKKKRSSSKNGKIKHIKDKGNKIKVT